MGIIRECAREDVSEVADLWARTFRLRETCLTDSLADYLREIFFSNPWYAGDQLPSLVHPDPYGDTVGPDVEVIAELDGEPVLLRDGTVLVAAFHPELTDDARIHERFLELVTEATSVRA